MILGHLGGVLVSVVVCTALSGKKPHREIGVLSMVTSGSLGGVIVSVVVCTDLSGKEPHIQVGVGRGMISGNLGDVMIITLDWNARYVGSIPALGNNISHCHHIHDKCMYIHIFPQSSSEISTACVFMWVFGEMVLVLKWCWGAVGVEVVLAWC